ncbi:serine hydrolase [Carboxylicivirga sp. A043]|uniref:serine hydrolase domain-containing protein n=1 Tax=Carboxylicivirga litoralis TaxID=2816963 RepID=UPI0021CB4657|nr:serine hydrolase [Carboxylicivirga sp. A043]MCU4154434.1 serine hydrolase [Carboxylicivirga sp. A043]
MKIRIIGIVTFLIIGQLHMVGQNQFSSCVEPVDSIVKHFQVIRQSGDNFPITDLESEKIGFLINDNAEEWNNYILRYNDVPIYKAHNLDIIEQVESDFIEHLIVVADSLYNRNQLLELQKVTKLSLLLFGDSLCESLKAHARVATNALYCYKNCSLSRDLSIQYVFRGFDLKEGGVSWNKSNRLNYLPAEFHGLNGPNIKHKVDSIAQKATEEGAFPGCRILVAYKGTVIFNESYGFHTFNKRVKVQQHDVYDLASVTKISGPLPLIMKACDENLMDLDAAFYTYWPDWKKRLFHRSNKEEMTLREVLAHQARLTPYINYYPWLLNDGHLNDKYFQLHASDKYALKIDDNLYLSTAFKKKVYKAIRKSPLLDEAKYKYSGLSYMIYPQLLSELYQNEFESLLYKNFFTPLGASSLVYNPMDKMEDNRIVPTEYDGNFRKKQIKGVVHDEAAAVMGGVSGNAGLFSSADDLAKLMQMYLNRGSYAGKEYISEEVIDEFSKVQYPDNENRRGAGFDKPLFGNDTLSIKESYPAPGVSSKSFGHSGFTGTFVWVDPEYELVYIFLSNRVYPSRNNRLIYQMNVRPSIQQIFYDAIKEKESTSLLVNPD